MKTTSVILVTTVCVLAAGYMPAQAATIVLKSGKTVSGPILEETPEYIRIQQGETPIYYQRTYIVDVIRDDSKAESAALSETPGADQNTAKDDLEVPDAGAVAATDADYLTAGLRFASQGAWDKAQDALKMGEVNNPYDPNILGALDLLAAVKAGRTSSECGLEVFKGTYALMKEDYPEAVTHLEKARTLDPGQPDVSYNLGVAYYSMGEFPKALDALKQVLRIKADDAPTYVLVGNIYQLLGDKEKAQENFYIAQTLFDKGGNGDAAD
jgi:tetratricopeptide (TPR) repeat protein